MNHITEDVTRFRVTVPAGLLDEFVAMTHESFWSSLARLVSMDQHSIDVAESALRVWKRSKLAQGNSAAIEPKTIELEIPSQIERRFVTWACSSPVVQSHWVAVALIAAMLAPDTKVDPAYGRKDCCG